MLAISKDSRYWDSFYKKSAGVSPRYPSQFAAFALPELANVDGIVEFGCGTGRDSEFFSHYGFDVLAIDGSAEAINFCQKTLTNSKVTYINRNLVDAADDVKCFSLARRSVALYARFFLHAIDEVEEEKFFSLAQRSLAATSLLALEYRTSEDATQPKVFGQHYRRYLKHDEVLKRVERNGFRVLYQTEGIGFAKYKQEDALVGRCIAAKI